MRKEVELGTNIVRHSIVGLARGIREKGLPAIPTGDDPLSKSYIPESQEAIDAWNANKPERNALIAVLVDRVINRAITGKPYYPPYGLVNWRDPNKGLEEFPSDRDAYYVLHMSMTATLERVLDYELHEWERLGRKEHRIPAKFAPNKLLNLLTRGQNRSSYEQRSEECNPNPTHEAYVRFKEIMAFQKIHKVGNPSGKFTVSQMLKSGIVTASSNMTALLEVIPKVYTEEFSNKESNVEDLMGIARNSYYLLAESAAEHIYRFDRRTHLLGEGEELIFDSYRLHPDKFILSRTGSGLYLAVKEDIRQQLKNDFNFIPNDCLDTGVETGCPALVPFDGKSAIRKLWDWHLEIAEKIYSDQHQ